MVLGSLWKGPRATVLEDGGWEGHPGERVSTDHTASESLSSCGAERPTGNGSCVVPPAQLP